MSRGFSESCVPFQGVTEPGERGRGPSGGSAGDLGIPFWGSLVGLEPVGPHASSSELERWTAVRCWRIGSWCGNAYTSVAWITSLQSCQARRRAGSTSAWVSARSQTQNLSKRLNLEERNCASAGAGAGLLAVTSSPREGRKEGRRASEGLSGLCFNDDASGRGGVSAAGKWWQVSGLGWRRGRPCSGLGFCPGSPGQQEGTAFPLCACNARKARS